jgi:hypothetical protein
MTLEIGIIIFNIITFLFSEVSEEGFRKWVGMSYGSLLGYFIAHWFII